MSDKIKICHFTSVHPANDCRIFDKECTSLAKAGYDVYLIAPNAIDEIKNGVHIIGVPEYNTNRWYRMLILSKNIYKKALSFNADIYHFHDPELLIYALRLKKKGKKVIFDSHENVPSDILEKEWIPKFLRNPIANIYMFFEKRCLKNLDAVISVTPILTNRIKKINANTFQITNYPIVDEKFIDKREWGASICFAGGISKQWMHENLIKALFSIKDITYNLAGVSSEKYMKTLVQLESWNKVNFIGKIPHHEVFSFMQKSSIGIALNDYTENVGNKEGSLGNTKLFEYMQAGIPIICTDFILWKQIIEDNNCGICVNPHDIDAIANAIKYLITNPDISYEMGNNGRTIVLNKYNWETQEYVLIKLYEMIATNQ